VVGLNTHSLVPYGTNVSGAQMIAMESGGQHLGSRALNPYIFASSIATPYISGLVDGAEVYGMTTVSAEDMQATGMFADAPDHAMIAMCLLDMGLGSGAADWDGYDMLLLANLTDESLVAPLLGVGRKGYLTSLMSGGFTRDALFGGSGPDILHELPALGVYAILVPEGTTHFNVMASGGEFTYIENLAPGGSAYMVPEPATMSLLGIGAVAVIRRRRGRITSYGSSGDRRINSEFRSSGVPGTDVLTR